MIEESLAAAAAEARRQAYAPYSQFAVGAALRSAAGDIFTGCNVENISFGLTICAERVAVGKAIAAGVRQFSDLALVSDSVDPVVPCGACRQVLAEFGMDLRIVSRTVAGASAQFALSALLPMPRQGILG